MSPRRWDAIVAGAGPAGAATAILLAREGFAVLLLDRAAFPRRKPCGEFLSPAATPLLEDLGVRPAVEAAGARRLATVVIDAHGAEVALRFPAGLEVEPWGFALSRRRLDPILVDAARAAGAEVRERTRVERPRSGSRAGAGVLARGPDGAPEEHRARLLVGAGGRNCPVARGLGLQRRDRRRRYDLLAHREGPAPSEACELRVAGSAYVAAAPVEGGLVNVNCVVDPAALRRAGDPATLYDETLAAFPAAAGWTRGARVEPVVATDVTPLSTERATADGALLVGDAALFLDPFTGQGLYLALRSARLAADAAIAALHAGRTDQGALAPYDRARAREFDDKRRESRAIQALLRRPALARAAVRGLARDPAAAELLAATSGDMIPASRVATASWLARVAWAARPRFSSGTGTGTRAAPASGSSRSGRR